MRPWGGDQRPLRMYIRHDPVVGHLFIPGIQVRIPGPSPYLLVTNGQGFRSDRDYHCEKGRRHRLILLGDSHAAGDGLENRERFSDLLESDFDGLECANLAVNGTGFDQQILIYEKFCRIDHDWVCFAPHVWDIMRLGPHFHGQDPYTGELYSFAKPYFTLEANQSLRLHNVPVPVERLPWVSRHNRLQRALLDSRLHHRLPLRVNELALSRYWRRLDESYADPQSDAWRLTRALIGRLAHQARGRPVLLCPIPDPRLMALSNYRSRFRELEEEMDSVFFLDLARHIRRFGRRERWRMHSRATGHYSVFGHQVLTRALSSELVDRGLLPEPVKRQARPLPAPCEGSGDLWVLGVSAFYHDSACTLVRNGEIVAAAQEERFSRVKNDARFPNAALNYCLEEAGIPASRVDAIAFYDNPMVSLQRILATIRTIGPEGPDLWLNIAPRWLAGNLSLAEMLKARGFRCDLVYGYHHLSHAASAFFPSPFKRAAILTIDGVGEWATASIGRGAGTRIELLKELRFPHSLGLLYSAFTSYLGFKVNEGEYKMMGLASYGRPTFADRIKENLVHVHSDGSIRLNMEYFGFLAGRCMTNDRFHQLFEGPPRDPSASLTQRHMDLARSIQEVAEEVVLKMARHARAITDCSNLCLAGGVALNCVANGRLLREGIFEDLWIQPAAGDAGGSLGAALWLHHQLSNQARCSECRPTNQKGSFLGPLFSDCEIEAYLQSRRIPYRTVEACRRAEFVADQLVQGKAVGHYSGRMEFGPRALGARSILADARSETTQSRLNLLIKKRESFRPFAPAVLRRDVQEYFDLDRASPYMLLVAPVRRSRRLAPSPAEDIIARVNQKRSDIPAVTHVDYSARVQTVERERNPAIYDILEAFKKKTGYGIVVNTSFNVKDEPIVCTPHDALTCFLKTDLDVLVMGSHVVRKVEIDTEQAVAENGSQEAHFAPSPRLLRNLAGAFRQWVESESDRSAVDTASFLLTAKDGTSQWREVVCRTVRRSLGGAPDLDSEVEDFLAPWEPRGRAERETLRRFIKRLLALRNRFEETWGGQREVSRSIYQMY